VWTTLLAPDPEDPTSPTRELDEWWSLVLKTANDSWMGMALCRKRRQVVAYAVGDRSKKTYQRWWEAIAAGYRQGHGFTDALAASTAVIPKELYTAVGKETGEPAHAERWNPPLRQRLARFVRLTWSFSRSVIMPEACLLLFLHRSQTQRAILLK
jgi:insertion element IS1 protein InsB